MTTPDSVVDAVQQQMGCPERRGRPPRHHHRGGLRAMTTSSDAPVHNRAQWRRPTFTRTTAADHSVRYLGRLRSSCGHTLGVAAVWQGRQWVVQWAVCR